MSKTKQKKVILFIVEGPSDETSFNIILSRLIKAKGALRFQVVHGDLTSDPDASEILEKVTIVIDDFLGSSIYRKEDILCVIHLVDIDGAFINDNCVVEACIDEPDYQTDKIICKNAVSLRSRNKRKSLRLRRLMATKRVYVAIPYFLYYFSCNLEHVLHNNANVSSSQKEELACVFRDKYQDNLTDFLQFIHNDEIAVPGTYKETFKFIQLGNNSLRRCSNFHIFFDRLQED